MRSTDTELGIPGLLDAALQAARAGASVLREGYGAIGDIRGKGEDGNLVTDIDVAAEHATRESLARNRPNDLITGEELPDVTPLGAVVRWSIDPLDGTTNFTRGIPYFATSVAAVEIASGEWLVGTVNAPLLDRTYFAARGLGAWLDDPSGLHRLLGPNNATSARLLGTGYSYSAETREEQYAAVRKTMAGFTDTRALGSAALAICAVAEGALDAYIESDLDEYDWAGAAVVAEQAGLAVVRPTATDRMLRVEPPPPL